MQLKVSTDYALRIMMFIANAKEIVTSRELSERLLIPQSLVFKICKKLGNGGMIKITTGVQGGFTLLKRPEDISLYDIIDLFEPTVQLNRCLESDEFCSLCATNYCPAHKFFCKLQREMDEKLSKTTLKDLLDNNV